MKAPPGSFTHGTQTGYKRGCRCGPCRQAKHRVNARRNKTSPLDEWELLDDGHWFAAETPVPQPTSGPTWRCGCDPWQVRVAAECPACETEAPWG